MIDPIFDRIVIVLAFGQKVIVLTFGQKVIGPAASGSLQKLKFGIMVWVGVRDVGC